MLQRNFVANGETVLIEDPVYPGLKIAFQRAGGYGHIALVALEGVPDAAPGSSTGASP